MQKPLTAEQQKALEEYKKEIHAPTGKEVRVRVVSPPGFWYCPTPRMGKMYTPGEELTVPEHIYLNSNYHEPKKTPNGVIIRGVLELADHPQADANQIDREDLRALQERNAELERKLAALTGSTPPVEPLVVVDGKGGKPKPKKEEI